MKITNVTDENLTGMKLYFDIGMPHNHTAVFDKMITLTPKLKSISPATGSVGGTLITAEVKGIGQFTEGISLQTKAGTDICQEIKVVAYGKVECLTKTDEIAADTEIKIKYNTDKFELCPTCKYS